MAVAFYMDVHIPAPITKGLRRRGVEVMTAQDDEADELSDPDLLDRATVLERVLFTFDNDLLTEATRRQRHGQPFAGLIYAHLRHVSIGACIRDLEVIAKAGNPEDLADHVLFLPL